MTRRFERGSVQSVTDSRRPHHERHRPATREDHDDFCVKEGWSLVRGATGQPVRHHRTYELALWDGRILRTRISRPVDRSEYSRSTWSHILREQLAVTAEEFWACVSRDRPPDRGAPPTERPGLPYALFRQLTDTVGLEPADAAGLTAHEATERIALYWTERARP